MDSKLVLQIVDVAPKLLDKYEAIIGEEQVRQIEEMARQLRDARIAHVNATPYGGGVSELLRSVVALHRGLGINTDWLVIPGTQEFFEVTKGFHNALQGAAFQLTDKVRDIYLGHSQRIASLLDREYDFIVVHDPQPARRRPGSCLWPTSPPSAA